MPPPVDLEVGRPTDFSIRHQLDRSDLYLLPATKINPPSRASAGLQYRRNELFGDELNPWQEKRKHRSSGLSAKRLTGTRTSRRPTASCWTVLINSETKKHLQPWLGGTGRWCSE